MPQVPELNLQPHSLLAYLDEIVWVEGTKHDESEDVKFLLSLPADGLLRLQRLDPHHSQAPRNLLHLRIFIHVNNEVDRILEQLT